ncbi:MULTISPECIES: TatD family hydrolase [unclassified Methylophaga]|uniref:TatD family hydrolase n=1 Tax=unclassified Methylophaga TaxID=2629249 RepID=UPI000C8B3110|nr:MULTISPECIES: TatD family hydrolase [unclassified Methylophaga]MBN45595.1 DNAase [Methylophaga sp.]|tara:strand:+ start:78908 stop:79672 length:765 start_codon:yes stop_codon:yes gene_type:complete
MLHLIDSHCHLDFREFDTDRDTILQNCLQSGIEKIVIPGVTVSSWQKQVKLCQSSPMLSLVLGCHPMFMDEHPDDAMQLLDDAVQQYKPIAIGEIGLDFYVSNVDMAAQLSLFDAQLDIAVKYALPVILHVRKAHDEVLKLLRQKQLPGGIVHAFSGSAQQAEQYRKLNFLLGIGGALTYPRAQRLQRLFTELPLSQIVLETDAPDMPLCGHQGERNSPENIPVILEKLSQLRGESIAHIAEITSANCRQLFNI